MAAEQDGTAPRVVVVVGASSGIGRATALRLAGRGDRVVLAARSRTSLEHVAVQCRALGADVLVVVTDVTDDESVQALCGAAVAWGGRVDVWVDAAAVWSYGRFEDTPADVFDAVVATTFRGQVACLRAVLPHFRDRGRGVYVAVASLYGLLGAPLVAPYVAGKWALVGFTEAVRHELRDAPDIHLCTVLPGTVDTPIYRHAANRVGRRIRPLPPVTSPERVAAAVVRLTDRPRPRVVVGRTQHLGVWTYRLLPRLYDVVAGPVVERLTVLREPDHDVDGTVFAPDPATNAVRAGWRARDGARLGLGAGAAGAVLAGGAAALVRRAVRGR